jgi:chemotaxis response regulator CheB
MNHVELMARASRLKQADREAKVSSTSRVFEKQNTMLKRHGNREDEEADEDAEDDDDDDVVHGDEKGGDEPGDLSKAHQDLQGNVKKKKKQRKGSNDLLTPQESLPFLGGKTGVIGIGCLNQGVLSIENILSKLTSDMATYTTPVVQAPSVPPKDSFKKKLAENDELFKDGVIDEEEHNQIRRDLIKSFSNNV